MGQPTITVIVRARDEAASIGRCLDLLATQRLESGPPEVILVDSGSRDGTPEIARDRGATVLSMPAHAFTFGGALNLGARHASGALLVALSAHAFPRSDGWLEDLAGAMTGQDTACACGDRYHPDGTPLTAPVRLDDALQRAHPEWGYSNAAGAFRAELWRERPFREDLPACEDREWGRHWLARGYVCVIDPRLAVDHDHTHDPVLQIYRRARREAEGFAAFLEHRRPHSLPDLAREWWTDLRFYDSAAKARLSPQRAARLLGAYAGRRRVPTRPAPRWR